MSGPIVASIITSTVALVVAIGSAVRAVLSAAIDRRYERRRAFLIDAQDAMLVLREALDAYGAALNHDATDEPVLVAESQGTTSFAYGVADATNLQVRTAQGRLDIARSRVDDDQVVNALVRWQEASQVSLLSDKDLRTAAEDAAFAEVNNLIGAALRSGRVRVRKRRRAGRR